MSFPISCNKSFGQTTLNNPDSYVIQHRENKSPIDSFYEIRTETILATNLITNPNEFLGALLVIKIISATENYFRSMLYQAIKLCPISQRSATNQSISLGSLLWGSGALLSHSTFENISFVASGTIKKNLKSFLSYDIGNNSPAGSALAEYEKLCELRHCIVHSACLISGKNAIKVGLTESDSNLKIKANPREVIEAASICTSLVTSTNTALFELFCRRWATDWRNRPGWREELSFQKFKNIWNLFVSETDRSNSDIENISIIKARNRVKNYYGID